MKKHFLFPIFFGAFLLFCNTSCQKETQNSVAVSELTSEGSATDRTGYTPYNPCGNRQTVWVFNLAGDGLIINDAFKPGWKSGELDRIANDCVLGGTLPGNCAEGGIAYFSNNPAFNLSNFIDANGYVSPQQQDRIISMALALAKAQITSCGAGTSPKIYQIDFILPFQYPVIEFAVRYSCCPSLPSEGG